MAQKRKGFSDNVLPPTPLVLRRHVRTPVYSGKTVKGAEIMKTLEQGRLRRLSKVGGFGLE